MINSKIINRIWIISRLNTLLRAIGQAWLKSREGKEDEKSMVPKSGGGGFQLWESSSKDKWVIYALCWYMIRGGRIMSFALRVWEKPEIINGSQMVQEEPIEQMKNVPWRTRKKACL